MVVRNADLTLLAPRRPGYHLVMVGPFRAVLLLTLVATSIGCATSRGDDLMGRGAFMEAESAYGAELTAAPGNADLERKQIAAREAAVRDKLESAAVIRGSGHIEAALATLREALRLEARWSLVASPSLAAARDAEIAAADQLLATTVRQLLGANAPLTAYRRADKLAPLLEDARLAPTGERIKAQIARVGRARCTELSTQAEDQPHLQPLIASYCGHFGGAALPKPTPEQRRGLRVAGKMSDASREQQQILESWLADVFRETPWFSIEAPAMTPVQVTGDYAAALERRRVTLTAPYREVVRSRIDDGNPFRPAATVETEVQRVFQYDADEYDARYALDVTLTLELSDGAPLVARIKVADDKRAYEHDVSFPRANVHPRRAQVQTMNDWLRTRLDSKALSMVRKLRSEWTKAFCAPTTFSPDEAARCLQGPDRKPAALAALRTVFGPDADALFVDEVSASGGKSRSPAETGKEKAKPQPEVEEPPSIEGNMI
jgi:hypothetical protein